MKTPLSAAWFAWLACVCPHGTSQCPVAIDFTPGAAFTRPDFYAKAFGQDLYFMLDTPATGKELWKWSPSSGMVLVADVKPGAGSSNPQQIAACCTVLGPRVFFSAAATGINYELFATTGTPGNFAQIAEIRPGSSGSLPGNMTPVGNRLFFTANDGSTGNELWVSDGTGAGTYRVRDIRPGTNSNPQHLVALGDLLVFSADDGNGRDLWVSDGSLAGTFSINDQVPALGQNPWELTPFGDVVMFTADEQLWKTDGTVAGTSMVADLSALWGVTLVRELERCGDLVFFVADTLPHRGLLFVSDGTAAGTVRVHSDPSNAVGSIRDLTCAAGQVFFAGSHWMSGQELWVSDGTEVGTVLAIDVDPVGSSSPAQLTPGAGGLFFAGDDGINGREPWFSDGTPTGSFMLCDLHPSGSSSPEDFHVIQGQLWMEAFEPSVGDEPHILATPGAHAESLGAGGAPDYPTLAIQGGLPVLGTTINIVADDGPAGHVGILFLGLSSLPAPPFAPLMQGGCDWVGLLAGTALAAATMTSPSSSLPLPLPNQPGLEGVGLHLQVVWFDAAANPLIQLSNGVQLVLGPAAPH